MAGQICAAGLCTKGECLNDEDCGPDETCELIGHTCVPTVDDSTGTTDAIESTDDGGEFATGAAGTETGSHAPTTSGSSGVPRERRG